MFRFEHVWVSEIFNLKIYWLVLNFCTDNAWTIIESSRVMHFSRPGGMWSRKFSINTTSWFKCNFFLLLQCSVLCILIDFLGMYWGWWKFKKYILFKLKWNLYDFRYFCQVWKFQSNHFFYGVTEAFSSMENNFFLDSHWSIIYLIHVAFNLQHTKKNLKMVVVNEVNAINDICSKIYFNDLIWKLWNILL